MIKAIRSPPLRASGAAMPLPHPSGPVRPSIEAAQRCRPPKWHRPVKTGRGRSDAEHHSRFRAPDRRARSCAGDDRIGDHCWPHRRPRALARSRHLRRLHGGHCRVSWLCPRCRVAVGKLGRGLHRRLFVIATLLLHGVGIGLEFGARSLGPQMAMRAPSRWRRDGNDRDCHSLRAGYDNTGLWLA